MKNEINITINNSDEKDLKLNINIDVSDKYCNVICERLDGEVINNTPLEKYSWKEIDDIVKKGLHTKLFKIGDTKSFKLNDETLIAEIVDFDHDNLSDDEGKRAGISFVLKKCPNKKYPLAQMVDHFVWGIIGRQDILKEEFYTYLPEDMKDVIKPVNKETTMSGFPPYLMKTSEELWFLSEKEMFGTSNLSLDGEGYQYTLYKDINKRKDKTDFDFWLRTPYMKHTDILAFGTVKYNGQLGSNFPYAELQILFGFCI